MAEPSLFGGIGTRKPTADPMVARFRRFVFFGVVLGIAAYAWNVLHPPEQLTVVRVELGLRPEDEAPAR